MSKIKNTTELKETFAHAKYLRVSPYKVRRVADLVRGKRVPEATAILNALPHKSAEIMRKVLKSAVANAVHNDKANEQSLVISTLLVNEAPSFKRYRARARGRMFAIIKRSSHVRLGVKEGS